MANHTDGDEAQRVVRELRTSAEKLIVRSRELADEAERLMQRADDLTQLIKRHDTHRKHRAQGKKGQAT